MADCEKFKEQVGGDRDGGGGHTMVVHWTGGVEDGSGGRLAPEVLLRWEVVGLGFPSPQAGALA